MGRKPSHLKLVDAVAGASDLTTDGSGLCGRPKSNGGTCGRPAGWGTDHKGEGPCRDHEGSELAASSCPLPLTALQRQLWDDFLPRLAELGLDKGAFWPNLYGLVVALADLRIHSKMSADAAEPVKGENGAPKKHPSATIVNQRLSQVGAFMDRLGLTAAAMSKAPPPGGGGGGTALEKLIAGSY